MIHTDGVRSIRRIIPVITQFAVAFTRKAKVKWMRSPQIEAVVHRILRHVSLEYLIYFLLCFHVLFFLEHQFDRNACKSEILPDFVFQKAHVWAFDVFWVVAEKGKRRRSCW